MTGHVDVERILDAYLAPDADQLPDRIIEASLSEIARTAQRRRFVVPWRWPGANPALQLALVALEAPYPRDLFAQDAREAGVGAFDLHHRGDELLRDLFGRRGGELAQAAHHELEDLPREAIDELADHGLFVRKVLVQRSDAHAGALGDAVRAQLVVAAIDENVPLTATG